MGSQPVQRPPSSPLQLDAESEVNNEMANRMSLFYAEATPMLKTLSNATTKFVSEVSEGGGTLVAGGSPRSSPGITRKSREGNSSRDLLGFRTRRSQSRTRLTA